MSLPLFMAKYALDLQKSFNSSDIDFITLKRIERKEKEENYLDSYEYMASLGSLDEIFDSNYFIENFLMRYTHDIPLFAKEVCNTDLTWQQVEICNAHNPYGGRLAVPSGHGCGKTKIIGILALHHMLTIRKSITRVQAPKLEQITKLSFGEVISSIDNMRLDIDIGGNIVPNQWAFLANFFQINKRIIYVKNFETQWYIESAVAKRGESNSLSGQHNWSYLIIFDEACGIEDGHIVASLGGLSEERNSCIAFSQHANTTSLFHQFVTTLNVDNGGVWNMVRLNSEESPLVSITALENYYATYTDDEYRVRVEGLFPLNESGNLFSLENMQQAYRAKKWIRDISWSTRAYATDIAFKGMRDSSVTVKANITQVTDLLGISKLYVEVTNIEVFHKENKKRPTEVGKLAIARMVDELNQNGYVVDEYIQGVDASSGGHETFLTMEDEVIKSEEQIDVYGLEWGGNRRLSNKERREYANERAKGYVQLRKAIAENRFIISTQKYKTRILFEMEKIPFVMDAKYRYQMVSKKDMGTSSPDILDCFAELFIMPYYDNTDKNEFLIKDISTPIKRRKQKEREVEEIPNFSIDIAELIT